MADRFLELLLSLPPLLLALTVHEYFHGFVAYRMGDPTAKFAGRLTFNPLKHIDPIGFIAFLLFRFGWAKPVPVNPYNFYDYKKGMVLTSIAGPGSNLGLAFISGMIIRIAGTSLATPPLLPLAIMLKLSLFYNLILCAFNLIPIPPLDGSNVLFYLLPDRYAHIRYQLERYGFIILVGLILIDNLGIPLLWGWIGPFVLFFSKLFAGFSNFYI
uniref:Site-2 protease family protein n=1 Tax=candidate division WOR-3 bacterium TaxID=2052148 RepID=A0A7C6EIC0_UNCW3